MSAEEHSRAMLEKAFPVRLRLCLPVKDYFPDECKTVISRRVRNAKLLAIIHITVNISKHHHCCSSLIRMEAGLSPAMRW